MSQDNIYRGEGEAEWARIEAIAGVGRVVCEWDSPTYPAMATADAAANELHRRHLRDEFAKAALTGGIRFRGGDDAETRAADAYEMADAMMAARKPKESK